MRNWCIWAINRQVVPYLSGAFVHIPRGANVLLWGANRLQPFLNPLKYDCDDCYSRYFPIGFPNLVLPVTGLEILNEGIGFICIHKNAKYIILVNTYVYQL
jgi:hypothetical protein